MNTETNKEEMPLEKLFGSKTRAKLLALFFDNPEKSYYVREITRVIDEQVNSVRRELSNLSSLGLVKIENFENKVYYSANMKHPFAKPMVEMFSKKISSFDIVKPKEEVWASYIRPVNSILDALLVTNRLPGEEGIDLLIIGDDEGRKLTRWAEVVEKRQGKPLNFVVMNKEDYLYRKSVRDKFLSRIFELKIEERYDPEGIL